MAAQMCDVEVWVMLNADGEYVAHVDEDKLAELYAEDVGELAEAAGLRRVKVKLSVPLPVVFELSGAVKVEEECGELKAV